MGLLVPVLRGSEKLTGVCPTVPGEGGGIAERLPTADGVADVRAFTGAGRAVLGHLERLAGMEAAY